MRKIAFINQKGGVGKTTTCVTLGAALAELGKKVLVVDMDPQANASIAFGISVQELEKTLYDVITRKCTGRDAIIKIKPNLDLLPSNVDLAGAEVELVTQIGREHALKEGLDDVVGYDFVLVDCPPSLGILNINALAYVNEVFVPLQCEFFALQGIGLLLNTLDLVQKRINPALQLGGVIACMYDSRKSLSGEVVGEISKHFGDKVFATRIRNNVRLAEAPSFGQTVLEYAPDSNGAEDYRALAKEVLGASVAACVDVVGSAKKQDLTKQPHKAKHQSKKTDAQLTPVAAMPEVGKEIATKADKHDTQKKSALAQVEVKKDISAAPKTTKLVETPKTVQHVSKPLAAVAVAKTATVQPSVSVAKPTDAKIAPPVVQARKRGRPPKNPEVYNSITVAEPLPQTESNVQTATLQTKAVKVKAKTSAVHNRISSVPAAKNAEAKKATESATILAGEIKQDEVKELPSTQQVAKSQTTQSAPQQGSARPQQAGAVSANLRPGRKKRI